MKISRALPLSLFLFVGTANAADIATLKFSELEIEPNIGKVCYALCLADVNGDGLQDAVAVSENRVLWYENPTWKSHVVIADQTVADNVCIAPYDIDGDGRIDFAIGAGWTGKNTGTIQWVKRNASLDAAWNVYQIGVEPSLHRMRFADVLGTGRAQLTISPLAASKGEGVWLTAFEIPAHPEQERWQPTVLNHSLNRMHNHWHLDFDGNGSIDTLTASREGINLITRTKDGFEATKIGSGANSPDPNLSGAGEIRTGHLKNGQLFIATVEPMHGNSLTVYLPPSNSTDQWTRQVIDEGFKRGHALGISDLDGDGTDEIVFGHSDTPNAFGVNVYSQADTAGKLWLKQVVDAGGMATEDLVVGDLNGDGRPDIVAGGRSTHNVKIYWNHGPASAQ